MRLIPAVLFVAALATGCGRARCNALHAALDRGDTHEAVALLERGAETTCRVGPEGWTAIHRAAALGRVDALRTMADYRPPMNITDDDTRTPLFVATRAGQYEAAEFLLAHGADVRLGRSCCGETALHSAGRHGDPRIATLLLEHGADPNAGDRSSQTPLMLAMGFAERNRAAMVDTVLAHGGDPDVHSETGATALMSAARRGDEASAARLLAAGALVNATDRDGHTAWDYAESRQQIPMTRMLEAHGGHSAGAL